MANSFPKIGNVDFDWNDLKYALTVARLGGLSHAAQVLGTSASTVSRHILQLEESLGQTLFLRQQSGYLLTDEGKEILELIAGVEKALLALDRHPTTEAASTQVGGLVRLACVEMVATHLIIPHLPKLYASHPALRVELVVDLNRADLNRREADLALRLLNAGGKVSDPDYVAHMIGRMEYAPYHSRQHQTGQGEAGYRPISWGQEWSHLPMAQWLEQKFKSHPAVLNVNSANAQLQAIRHGIGIGMLPCYVGKAETNLVEFEPGKNRLLRDLWLLYHRDLKASNRVQVMRNFLTEVIRETLLERDGSPRPF